MFSDELKARSYVSDLACFKTYSAPSKSEEPKALPPPPPPPVPAIPFKTVSPLKRPRKRVTVESLDIVPSLDQSLWRRTQRSSTKKKFGPQWIEYNAQSKKKKKKSRSNWIET